MSCARVKGPSTPKDFNLLVIVSVHVVEFNKSCSRFYGVVGSMQGFGSCDLSSILGRTAQIFFVLPESCCFPQTATWCNPEWMTGYFSTAFSCLTARRLVVLGSIKKRKWRAGGSSGLLWYHCSPSGTR